MVKAVFSPVFRTSIMGVIMFALLPPSVLADTSDDIVNTNINRSKAGAASQKKLTIYLMQPIK